MSKKKKRKHSVSKEEKELIQKMKKDLRMMGVPRDQWSRYIQEELRMRRKSKGIGRSKFMNRIKKSFNKVVRKVASKKLGDFDAQLGELEELLKQGSQDEMDFMNRMFPDIKFENINELGKHGTTLKRIPKKKKIIVELDSLDDED